MGWFKRCGSWTNEGIPAVVPTRTQSEPYDADLDRLRRLPIFSQTLGDVLAWHWVNPVRLHLVRVPEYHMDGTTGGYLRRFSCRVCIFSTDADLRAIHQNDPEAFEQVSGLETKLGFMMRPGASLVQIVEPHVSAPAETERQKCFSFCP